MTSQRFSSSKQACRYDLKRSLKRLSPLSVIMLIVNAYFFVTRVIDTFGYYANEIKFNNSMTSMDNWLNLNLIPEYEEINLTLILIAFGALFAIFGFAPFLRKKNINFYYASPVSRKDLFKNKAIASTTLMTAPLAVLTIIDTVINCHYLSNDAFVIKMALSMFAQCWLYAMVAFAVFAIAMCCASNLVEGAVFGVGLYMLPTGLATVVDLLCQAFLNGYARVNSLVSVLGTGRHGEFYQTSIYSLIANFNPITYGNRIGSQRIDDNILSHCFQQNGIIYNENSSFSTTTAVKRFVPDVRYYIPLVIWAVVLVALVFVARYCFVKRKADNAGLLSKSKFIIGFVATELALGVSTSLLVFDVQSEIPQGLFVFVMALIFAIVLFVAYSIGTKSVKHPKKHLVSFAVMIVMYVGTIGVLSSGLFGYSTYVPDVDDIKFASMANANISADMSVSYGDGIFAGAYMENKPVGFFDDKEDLEVFVDINKALVNTNGRRTKGNMSIVYQLKNGKRVYRRYDTVNAEGKKEIARLIDTKAYRNAFEYHMLGEENNQLWQKLEDYDFLRYYDFFSESEEEDGVLVNGVTFNDRYDNVDIDPIEIDDSYPLKKALVDDLSKMTYKDIVFSNVKPLGLITLNRIEKSVVYYDESVESYDNEDCMDTSSIDVGSYYIYPYMTNTIACLKDMGLYDELVKDDDELAYEYDKVYIIPYGEYGDNIQTCGIFYDINNDPYYNEFLNEKYLVTDDKKVDYYKEHCIPYRYADKDDYLVIFAGGYDHSQMAKSMVLPKEMFNKK